jgi:hypothetical protein
MAAVTRYTELTGCRVPDWRDRPGGGGRGGGTGADRRLLLGRPGPALVEVAHRGGALACWQVGSLAAARAAVSAGCDIVAVQGTEAGGHVRGHSPLRPLLESVRGLGDDLSQGGQRVPVPRGYGTPPGAAATGHIDAMPMYAGESVAAITAVEPAAAILEAWSAAL